MAWKQSKSIVGIAVNNKSSSAPKWTFGYSIFWGGLSAILPFIISNEFPSHKAAVVTMGFGVLTIVLGFLVYKRIRWAAWALVILALLDTAARAIQGHSGYLMPGLMLAFALTAAVKLGRERSQLPSPELFVSN